MQKHLCQTQVIPYLEGLAADGLDVTILSFEERAQGAIATQEREQMAALRARLERSGIGWTALRYHKHPSLPATAYDVIAGIVTGGWLIVRRRIDVVHARSHVAGVMGIVLKRLFGVRLVFDMRGLMAEEYVDAGTWKANGFLFRLTKRVERRLFRRADAIVMLTQRIHGELAKTEPALQDAATRVEIVPCCTDTERFAGKDGATMRARLGLAGKSVMVYCGSFGGWYLSAETAALFAEFLAAKPEMAHLLILTQTPHAQVLRYLEASRIDVRHATILTVASEDVAEHLAAADFAVSLIKPCFSKLASSPTKIGEYLAAGLPFISNRGIGDVDALLENNGVGVLLDDFSVTSYRTAIEQMLALLADRHAVSERCRRVAEAQFSLATVGRAGYRRVYERLGWRPLNAAAAQARPVAAP